MSSEDPAARDLASIRRILSAMLFGVVLILLVLTNPNEAAHDIAIRRDVARRKPVASLLGGGLFVSSTVRYHNYVFFSMTTYGQRTISIGVLGFVLMDQ
jgi:hypothetical protein